MCAVYIYGNNPSYLNMSSQVRSTVCVLKSWSRTLIELPASLTALVFEIPRSDLEERIGISLGPVHMRPGLNNR